MTIWHDGCKKILQELEEQEINTGFRIYYSDELMRGMENLSADQIYKLVSTLH